MLFKRIFAIIVVVFIIMACIPMSAFAVDPVTPAIMQNALAQAIASYTASHGASIMFDNFGGSNTWANGIYSLWSQFVDYMDLNHDTTIPDFPSLASLKWGTLFAKVRGVVQMVLDSDLVSYFDAFGNWLFGEKANMTKENDLYEFQSIDNVYQSIGVYSQYKLQEINTITLSEWQNMTSEQRYLYGTKIGVCYVDSTHFRYYSVVRIPSANNDPSIFYTGYVDSNNDNRYYPYFCSTLQGSRFYYCYGEYNSYNNTWDYSYYNSNWYKTTNSLYSDENSINRLFYRVESFNVVLHQLYDDEYNDETVPNGSVTECNETAYDYFFGSLDNEVNTITLVPYIGESNPTGQVYIPDNEDVNYAPIPLNIPIDVTWNDTLFGDGTDTLTNVQSQEIVNAITQEIIDTGTIELAQEIPVVDPGTEVYIPFLPVALPNFNFSLSGIWHYVREWISSLGAWFTMVLTVWSNLPYAMVVPVYATMVVLIVLGVYKRFFM